MFEHREDRGKLISSKKEEIPDDSQLQESETSEHKIHKPEICIYQNSECFLCNKVGGQVSRLRNDEIYYDWFVRDITKVSDQKPEKRKLDDSDDGNEIVIKHFKPDNSSEFFRTITGSEFSVGSAPETSNDDDVDLTEQEKAIYREKEKDMARSLLHILTAPYFELKYPEEKRAMFIMSRASENLLSLTRELFTMYRHVIRRRGRIYMQTIDQKQCMI